MAKKANWLSNLRVDLADLEQGSHGYAGELSKEFVDRTFKDFYPRVAEGFRVEIADAANRVITVYSGVATDQNGQLINNEESLTTSRSITLTGDATYYIEVEFVENLGNTDARAFWDPTFDNGLDTSGDVLPDGRESSQNVATRKTHDWQIVSPPSTTAFQITATPSGVRVPVAIITVAGGAITAPAGTSVARTCFARTYDAAVTSIRGLNTRIFPDSFTARLGPGTANQEDLSVTSNDRENGILTLGAGTANVHDIGERIINQGSTVLFIDEAVAMDDSGGVGGGGPVPNVAGDGRVRMFQGDTEAGFGLSQDPAADTGESDIQIKNLKEQVDYIASQMLEMKFGAGSRDILGTLPPPATFAAADTVHYARSGGIINARAHTVSVGDGVTSWGDYNTTTSGSAQAALQAAADAIPAAGGILYVKAGTYDIVDTTVTVSNPTILTGDGIQTTVIRATGTAAAITIAASDSCSLVNIKLDVSGGTAAYALSQSAGIDIHASNCSITGFTTTANSINHSLFEKCLFSASSNANFAINWVGQANNVAFNRCRFQCSTADAAARCFISSGASLQDISFSNCSFTGNTTMNALVELPSVTQRIYFESCNITQATGAATALIFTAVGATDVHLSRCEINCFNGVGLFDGVDRVNISDCNVAVPQDGSAILFDGNCFDILIDKCVFTQATTDALDTGVAIDLGDISGGKVTNCHFIDCDFGMYVWSVSESADSPHGLLVSGCQFTRVTAARCRRGITTGTNVTGPATATLSNMLVSDCRFFGFADTSATAVYGIFLESTVTTVGANVSVSGCHFSTVGDISSGIASAAAVRFGTSGVTSSPVFFHCSVSNCTIVGVHGGTSDYGIFFENVRNASATGNNIRNIGGQTTSTTSEAIFAEQCNVVGITGNIVQLVGISSQAQVGGVIHVGTAGQSVQNDSIVISSNTIDGSATSTGSFHGIFLEDNARYVVVAGNTVANNTNMGSGVHVGPAVSSDSVDLGDISVTGNVIDLTTDGVVILMDDPNTFIEGSVAISGNTLSNFSSSGISVTGDVSANTACLGLSVSCNTIRTTEVGVLYGIYLRSMNSVAVGSNSVHLGSNGTGAQRGIYAISCSNTAISSNLVRVVPTGICHGISLQGVTDTTVSANMIHVEGDSLTNSYGIFDDGSSVNFASANHVTPLPGTGIEIDTGIVTTGDNKIT